MNKAAGIGAVIAVIIGIVIVSATLSMDFSAEDGDSASEKIVIEEAVEAEIVIEEIVIEKSIEEEIVIEEAVEELEVIKEEIVEEPEVIEEGRDISVELTESLNMKTP